MKTERLSQQPALEKKAGNGWWIAALINTIAIFLIGGLVLIFRDSYKSDLALISLSITISFFIGQASAVLILHIYKKRNQMTEQTVQAQPGDDWQKEKAS